MRQRANRVRKRIVNLNICGLFCVVCNCTITRQQDNNTKQISRIGQKQCALWLLCFLFGSTEKKKKHHVSDSISTRIRGFCMCNPFNQKIKPLIIITSSLNCDVMFWGRIILISFCLSFSFSHSLNQARNLIYTN